MNILITPKALSGSVRAIPSKSHAQRLLLAAALCEAPPAVLLSRSSEDIEAMKSCAQQLHSARRTPDHTGQIFDCMESGAVLRFLLPAAMAQGGQAQFLGRGRLPERPLAGLKEQMEAHGCRFSTAPSGSPAAKTICTVTGRLEHGDFFLPGNISSQYITGLLFALPLLAGDSRLHITTRIESLPYVYLTLQVLRQFGVTIHPRDMESERPSFFIPGGQQYRCQGPLTPEGDWSNAAFWYTADTLSRFFGGQVRCSGLDPASQQGDRQIAAICEIYRYMRHPAAKPLTIDAAQIPDLVPILSVLACSVPAVTRIIHAGRLRLKESDRLSAVADMLARLGAQVSQHTDGLTIYGTGRLPGGIVQGCNDHRIVMSAAIASILCQKPLTILGAEAVSKSYPAFFEDFSALGGVYRVL